MHGVRPWDLRLAQGAMPSVVPSVQQLEPLGDVTIVSLSVNGTPLRIVLPEAQAVGMKARRHLADRHRYCQASPLLQARRVGA